MEDDRDDAPVLDGAARAARSHEGDDDGGTTTAGTGTRWHARGDGARAKGEDLSLIHISEPTRPY